MSMVLADDSGILGRKHSRQRKDGFEGVRNRISLAKERAKQWAGSTWNKSIVAQGEIRRIPKKRKVIGNLDVPLLASSPTHGVARASSFALAPEVEAGIQSFRIVGHWIGPRMGVGKAARPPSQNETSDILVTSFTK